MGKLDFYAFYLYVLFVIITVHSIYLMVLIHITTFCWFYSHLLLHYDYFLPLRLLKQLFYYSCHFLSALMVIIALLEKILESVL